MLDDIQSYFQSWQFVTLWWTNWSGKYAK